MGSKKELSPEERNELIDKLQRRFKKNFNHNEELDWHEIQARLESNDEKMWSLHEMERTGGEPCFFSQDQKSGEYIFYDCSAESPEGRRSICYDQAALESRKKNKPGHSATGMAEEMGIELLNEEQYQELQKTGEFDTKTSSWISTPGSVREHGGAIFGDRRYGRVFIYHNGAESYYAARGFRGLLRV